MVMWHLVKMQGLTDAEASEECDPSVDTPTRITMQDLDTGTISVLETCVRRSHTPCDILNVLAGTYSPNDWSAECE